MCETTTKTNMCNSVKAEIMDIEDLHKKAVLQKSNTYIDPKTGFTVFTEYAHLKRGKCCGNVCRHCPYGWEKVHHRGKEGKLIRRAPRVRSGNKVAIKKLMDKVDTGDYFEKKVECDDSDEDEMDSESSDEEEDTDVKVESSQSQTKVLQKQKTSNDKKSTKSGGRHGGKHTSKNVPYTRTGDAGTSVLLTGERRSKDDDAFEAMGTVDELCSVVGVVHAELTSSVDAPEEYAEMEVWLLDIMSRLFDIGSHVAKPRKSLSMDDDEDEDDTPAFRADGVGNGFDIDHVNILEEWIDHMTDQLPELTSFILPTGSKASAQLHVARCVCRRAERRVLPLIRTGVCDPNAAKYLNRLSDFFFTAARWSNYCDGRDEVQYRRPVRGARQRDRVTVHLREEKKTD